MAGDAGRRIRVAFDGGLAMNAGVEFLHLLSMALGALCRCELHCGGDFMSIAVTGSAGFLAERAVNAVGDL